MIAAADWSAVIAIALAAALGISAGWWIGRAERPAPTPVQVDVDVAVIEAISDAVADRLDERDLCRVAAAPHRGPWRSPEAGGYRIDDSRTEPGTGPVGPAGTSHSGGAS